MPIYEYRCSKCGNEQENLIRSDSDDPVCDQCGGKTLNRKLSLFAVSTVSSGYTETPVCACEGDGCGQSSGACGHSGGCGCAG